MSNGTATPWNVLANAITKKVDESKAKRQKAKEQEEQVEFQIRMGAINDALSRPDDPKSSAIIDQSIEQMKKAVPKDTIPIIDAYHKVVGMVHSKRSRQAAQVPGRGQGQGQPPTPGAGGPNAGPSGPVAPPGAPPASPSGSGAALPAGVPPSLSLGQMATQARPSATQRGEMAAEEELGKTRLLRNDAHRAAENVLTELDRRGFKVPDEIRADILAQASGFKLSPQAWAKKMQRVIVSDPADPSHRTRIPGLQDMSTGEVFGPDGAKIENPQVVSASALKPKQGWQKVRGKIIGVLLDPMTGQIIPGTENPNILPPAQYLDKVQEGYIGFTDEDNNFVLVPKQTRTHPNVPETGGGGGGAGAGAGASAPAVPPAVKGPGKGKGATHGIARVDAPESAGKHLPPGSIVVGTKRASGQTLSRADAGRSIEPLIDKVEQLLEAPVDPKEPNGPKVKDKLGMLSGRWDKLEQKMGNLPGNLRELAGTLVSIYSLGGAMHGWRSAQVAEKFAATYGDLTSQPDSLLGGMRAMRGTAKAVENIAYPSHAEKPPSKGNKTIDEQADEILNAK